MHLPGAQVLKPVHLTLKMSISGSGFITNTRHRVLWHMVKLFFSFYLSLQ